MNEPMKVVDRLFVCSYTYTYTLYIQLYTRGLTLNRQVKYYKRERKENITTESVSTKKNSFVTNYTNGM